MPRQIDDSLKEFLNQKAVGPISIGALIKGFIIFFVGILILSVIPHTVFFIKQNHLVFGWRLMEALEKEHVNEARALILKREGINKNDQYDRSPLLLALEAGWLDLARLLVEAGADVNIESKILMTPLRIAADSGDLEMVKLLLAKGASPDAPEGEFPPVVYVLVKKHYDVARVQMSQNAI